jgi:Lrp/AsnC family transcriptional regulator, leucine-responsive regulatory protein
VKLGYDAQMPYDLDMLDIKILELVQRDARRSADMIGEEVGLSPSAVQRRLNRLRETKVIQAEIAVVDPKALNRPLTMIVDLELERENAQLLDKFKRWLRVEPSIQQAWYVTGDGDYVLVITARDVEEYDAFMQRLVAENPNVRRFQTRVSLSTLKRGLTVPASV